MKRNNLFLIFILLVVLILTACSIPTTKEEAGTNEKETYMIKVGHAASREHFQQKSFEKFKELVEKNSKGRIKVKIYPDSELGGEREMLHQLLQGDITMMAPSSATLAEVSIQMELWDLPYTFEDKETARRVLDGEVGQEVLDSLSDQGVIGLVYWENGFRHLTNSLKPVTSLQDMQRLKIRTYENTIHIKAWSATGATTIPIAFNELYAALKQKTVDAQETPIALMYAQKFYEVQKYITLTGHNYSPWPVVINKKFYNELPATLQKVVMDAAVETRKYNRQLSEEEEVKSLEKLKEHGMEVTELSDDQKQEFKQAMSGVYEDVKKDVGKELFDKLMKEVAK
jgi:tripartite ATP-independent transporter DctP family solute receptor